MTEVPRERTRRPLRDLSEESETSLPNKVPTRELLLSTSEAWSTGWSVQSIYTHCKLQWTYRRLVGSMLYKQASSTMNLLEQLWPEKWIRRRRSQPWNLSATSPRRWIACETYAKKLMPKTKSKFESTLPKRDLWTRSSSSRYRWD